MIPPYSTDELHLTAEQLTGYVDRALPASERSSAEAHLADCALCRQELTEVTETIRERRNRRRRSVGIPTAVAAAAAVVLLVYGPTPGQDQASSMLRDGSAADEQTGIPALVALTPAPGAAVQADSVEFVWKAAADGVIYRVTLANELGEVLWTEETADTTLRVPPDVSLERGRQHFWYVDALLSGARSATTGVQEFRVPE